MHRIIIFSLLLPCLLMQNLSAQTGKGNETPGYSIRVNIKPFKTGYLFLAHHYGDKQMLVDSAAIDPNGQAVFSGKEKLNGGIYMIAFPKKDGWLEVVIDKQQSFSIQSDSADLYNSMKINGSPDNELFREYLLFSTRYGMEMSTLQKQYEAAKTKADSSAIESKYREKGKEMKDFRDQFGRQHPEHLLTSVFNVFRDPELPESLQDPQARNIFFRTHYWDAVDLTDERLIRTPVLQGKIDRYFDQIVPPAPDTLITEVDDLMLRVRPNPEMRKYLLLYLTDKYINPKFMGQDAVFVHLFTKYYIPGEADNWVNEKTKKFIFDRGYSLMLNVVGEKAGNLLMTDTTGKLRTLYEVTAPYTVVCFWDPTCGHCQTEVPKLDSLYRASWKAKGVRMFGVKTDGPQDKWLEFIRNNKLREWTHVYQSPQQKDAEIQSNKPGFRQMYDVYQTPTIYLLDKDKKILAKKLNYEQLGEFMQHLFEGNGKK